MSTHYFFPFLLPFSLLLDCLLPPFLTLCLSLSLLNRRSFPAVIPNVEKGLRSMCCKWVLPQFTKLEMLSGDPHQGVCVSERERKRSRDPHNNQKETKKKPINIKTKTKTKGAYNTKRKLLTRNPGCSSSSSIST